jgi:hypothetical protein
MSASRRVSSAKPVLATAAHNARTERTPPASSTERQGARSADLYQSPSLFAAACSNARRVFVPAREPSFSTSPMARRRDADTPFGAQWRQPDGVVLSPCCVVAVVARERQFRLDWTAALKRHFGR